VAAERRWGRKDGGGNKDGKGHNLPATISQIEPGNNILYEYTIL